jgi:hypothetical protein
VHDVILPETLAALLLAFEECFTAPSFRNFAALVSGWIHCLGRRTVTGVALASGTVGERHISVFHRFFSRARWSLDAVGRVVFRLALEWLPRDQSIYLPLDDTLARKSGKCVALASIHHDPLLSSISRPFFSYGHCWVVLSVWVPHQTAKAVRRTAPMACIVFDLLVLWYAGHIARKRNAPWVVVPWYRRKTSPSVADMLACARRAGWRLYVSDPPHHRRRPRNPIAAWPDAVLATA